MSREIELRGVERSELAEIKNHIASYEDRVDIEVTVREVIED